MGILARAILKDYPQYASLFGERIVQIGDKKLSSHNALLKSFEGADGMKTGFICDSGYNVVASATRDKLKLIAVVLGEVSAGHRTRRASDMLQHGFDTHLWKEVARYPADDRHAGEIRRRHRCAEHSQQGARLGLRLPRPQRQAEEEEGQEGQGQGPSQEQGQGQRQGQEGRPTSAATSRAATDAKVAEPKAAKEAIATEAAAQ